MGSFLKKSVHEYQMAEVRRSHAPDEVFYIESVFRQEPIYSILLL